MFAQEGRIDVARAYLHPLAMDPHGGDMAEYAQGMFNALANVEEGVPFTYRPEIEGEDVTTDIGEGSVGTGNEPGGNGDPSSAE